jgi:hypothetical protein
MKLITTFHVIDVQNMHQLSVPYSQKKVATKNFSRKIFVNKKFVITFRIV